MTRNGEILKAIYDKLKEARIPVIELAAGLVVELELKDENAKILAENILNEILPFISD